MERQARLDRVLDDRMAARLDQLIEEDSYIMHEPGEHRRGRS